MVNLFDGGTKDFVGLWEIIHLKISTHFSIRLTKLFEINLKYYSQACSVNHVCNSQGSPVGGGGGGVRFSIS